MEINPTFLAKVEAMKKVFESVAGLPDEDARSVLQWALQEYGKQLRGNSPPGVNGDQQAPTEVGNFDSAASLMAAAGANTDHERALVVGYWFQVCQGQEDLDGASINRELTHMGHAATNITVALGRLISRKPQLVIQTRKTGKSRQARKRYKLTSQGIARVREMIAGGVPVE